MDLALQGSDLGSPLGPPSSQTCQAALCSTLSTCEELGLPVAPEKTEGPGAQCSPSWGLKLIQWPASYVFPRKNNGTSKQPSTNGCNLDQDQYHDAQAKNETCSH